jgi:hypothetical protein
VQVEGQQQDEPLAGAGPAAPLPERPVGTG